MLNGDGFLSGSIGGSPLPSQGLLEGSLLDPFGNGVDSGLSAVLDAMGRNRAPSAFRDPGLPLAAGGSSPFALGSPAAPLTPLGTGPSPLSGFNPQAFLPANSIDPFTGASQSATSGFGA